MIIVRILIIDLIIKKEFEEDVEKRDFDKKSS